MRIIFFGTSEFAIPSLKKMLESKHELVAVVTQPDRKKGRSLAVTPPPVKSALIGMDIPIYQPQDASSQDIIDGLKRYNADIFVVVSFGQILKKGLLDIPRLFCVNLHGSLLPKYRGAAPVNYAIINGEETTGVTTIRMNERMDGGDIILQKRTDILNTDTAETVNARLSEMGAALLVETIDLIESGKAAFETQDESKTTYAPKLKKVDGLIGWSMPSRDIHNRVRGLLPWPGAYTHWQGRLLKIYKSEFRGTDQKPATEGSPERSRGETSAKGGSAYGGRNQNMEKVGYIVKSDNNGIVVATGRGSLTIKILQLEGGKKLKVNEFLHGHKIKAGEKFQ